MPKSLPSRPSLEQLRNQAKDLLKSLKSGEADALKRFADANRLASNEPAGVTDFSLSEAQLTIAREYGFASWPKLKEHVDSITIENTDPMELFKKAFEEDDAVLVRKLLARFPDFKSKINDPVAAFDAPIITRVRSRGMLDVLLEAGADINAKSRWWAGGFGLLDSAEPDLAKYAIQRGAVVDVHAAARLGLMDRLRELITAQPALVNTRGGDGQTPLHFAGTLDVAAYLLDHGANIDARDVDHESTPAQYMVRDRQEVARYLVRRGCKTDILMAAALGDESLVRKHLDADPECVRVRVNASYFPMSNHKAGGTIYQWTLGFHVSAHDVARLFGHENVVRLLMERSPADVKLLAACWAGDDAAVRILLAEKPALIENLSLFDRRQIADAARNNNLPAVRTMLGAGLPVDALGQHGATPLHWAAYHGNAEMAREILRFNPPLEAIDADFKASPLGWALHGSEHGWYCRSGNYPATVELLLQAGAKIPDRSDGTEEVKAILRRPGR